MLAGALKGLRQFLVTENPLKMMKNTFYFTLKVIFVLKIFNFFFLTFWSCKKTAWFEKIRLIWDLIMSQTWKQTVEIQILHNMWRSKGNQTMEFGQLIEYNMRNIFSFMHKMWWRNYSWILFCKTKIKHICGSNTL